MATGEHDHHDETIGRIYSRREALRLTAGFGFGAFSGGLLSHSGFAAPPTTTPREPLVATPEMTEGPFFNDDKLNRTNLIGDTARPTVIKGTPLAMTIAVYKLDGESFAPMKNVQVDVWHCDAIGVYSGEDHPMNPEKTVGTHWLRGYQMTDDDGLVSFKTIVPGWYPGRATHVHFKVRPHVAEGEPQLDFTSQLYFHRDQVKPIHEAGVYADKGESPLKNEDDGIYNEKLADGSVAGDQMLLELAKADDGRGYFTKLPLLLTEAGLKSRPDRGPGGVKGRRDGR